MKFNHRKLKQARRGKNLTAYSAARELSKSGMNISHQTILNWEKGLYAPDGNQIADLAMFYGKRVLYFFCPKNTPK